MNTLRIFDAAGAIGTSEILFDPLPVESEIIVAEDDRFALAGFGSPFSPFGQQRKVAEIIGSFRYAEGPESETTPFGGRVDEFNLYIGNRKFASLEFDDPLSIRDFWMGADRWLRGDDIEVIGNSSANWLEVIGSGKAVLRGRDGDDTLVGYKGDRLVGGTGDDTYGLWNEAAIHERGGEGIDTVVIEGFQREYALGNHLENLVFNGFRDAFTGTGNGADNELTGGFSNDTLAGRAGDDVLSGGVRDDGLFGGSGDDDLQGSAGADLLVGGRGLDQLQGGNHRDRFLWRDTDESGVGASADLLEDFVSGTDTIDLADIDADTGQGGDQSFIWIGSAGFSGTAGEARFAGGRLSLDTDGDGDADMQIRIAGGASLAETDILL